jgi:hypothetical protein
MGSRFLILVRFPLAAQQIEYLIRCTKMIYNTSVFAVEA